MVSAMIAEVCNRMAVESAASFVFDDDMETTLEQTIANLVTENLDQLDQMALRVMASMAQASSRRGDDQMAEILMAMRAETLNQIKRIMPTEVQVLDGLLRMKDQTERRETLKVCLYRCTMDRLGHR